MTKNEKTMPFLFDTIWFLLLSIFSILSAFVKCLQVLPVYNQKGGPLSLQKEEKVFLIRF